MKKNARHHVPGTPIRRRRIGLGTRWPDGFRPLSLVPPLPDEPASDSGPSTEPTAPEHAPGSAGEAEFTPAQAEARAREITDWLAARQRRLDGSDDPSDRWRTAPPPPPTPPGPQRGRLGSPEREEPSEVQRESFRRINQMFQDRLVERWGGLDALEALHAEPLPPEPFDWSAVPQAHRERVEEILALVDDAAITCFDHEHRTACRRLLARVAGEPTIIARRGKVQTIAGAIVWTIASFNGTTGSRRRRGSRIVPASDIAAHLGLSSGSAFAERSIDICVTAGIQLHREGPEPIGEPGLIVARRRNHAVWLREEYRAALE